MKKESTVPTEVAEKFRHYCDQMALTRLAKTELCPNHARQFVEEFQSFLSAWRGRTGCPAFEAEMTAWANALLQGAVTVEQGYRDDLLEVLMARQNWLWAEARLRNTPGEIRRIQRMMRRSPSQRGKFQACQRRLHGREWDPVVEFQEAEAEADEAERKFREVLTAFETDWPERLSPTLRRRLRHVTCRGLEPWMSKFNYSLTLIGKRVFAISHSQIVALSLRARPRRHRSTSVSREKTEN